MEENFDVVEMTIKILQEELAKVMDKNDQLKKKLKKKENKKLTAYGTLYKDSCHKGDLCGKEGLGCLNPNCPMM